MLWGCQRSKLICTFVYKIITKINFIKDFNEKYHFEVIIGVPEEMLSSNLEKTAHIIKSFY